MVTGDVEFLLLLGMRDLNKLISKLELWRRECLMLVSISMFCNNCKSLFEETYLKSFKYYCIATEIKTIIEMYKNKIP